MVKPGIMEEGGRCSRYSGDPCQEPAHLLRPSTGMEALTGAKVREPWQPPSAPAAALLPFGDAPPLAELLLFTPCAKPISRPGAA